MKVVVLGASDNPYRHSHRVVRLLSSQGYDVAAIGRQKGMIGNIRIVDGQPDITDVHTLSLYLKKSIQDQIADYILSLNPIRIIFNPGAENTNLYPRLQSKGIKVEEACTMVLLTTGQFLMSE